MRSEKREPGDIIHEISLFDLLVSCGIQISKVAQDILQTDNYYSDRWQLDTGSALAGLSDMLHHAIVIHKRTLDEIVIQPPDDIMIVVTANPLRGNSMNKASRDD